MLKPSQNRSASNAALAFARRLSSRYRVTDGGHRPLGLELIRVLPRVTSLQMRAIHVWRQTASVASQLSLRVHVQLTELPRPRLHVAAMPRTGGGCSGPAQVTGAALRLVARAIAPRLAWPASPLLAPSLATRPALDALPLERRRQRAPRRTLGPVPAARPARPSFVSSTPERVFRKRAVLEVPALAGRAPAGVPAASPLATMGLAAGPTRAAAPPLDMAKLTDRVIRNIDRRIFAHRERRGGR